MRRSGAGTANAPRRLDAVQNEERIVETALKLLARDPQAAMDEIARAAEVGRATLYRHFSTREDLVEALRVRAGDDAAEAMRRSRLEEGSASAALGRLILELIKVGDRYQFLVQLPEVPATRRRDDLTAQFLALIRRGQDAGEFAAAAPAEWWIELVRAALVCGTRAVASGETHERAAEMAREVVLDGLRGDFR
jgi:TetR/AcrR family transcriptional repressor of mexCD-oprJ operon